MSTRLQELLDDAAIENIEIYGADEVVLFQDGRRECRPGLGESDLVSFLSQFAGCEEQR